MKPVKTISVESEVPAALEPLQRLGRNLRWSWNRPTHDLFREVAPSVWSQGGGNPTTLLQNTPSARLAELASDPDFLARVDDATAGLEAYRSGERWFQRTHPGTQSSIAYFSMEFGISPTLPIYSGGLGILAGDHLKSASDLGLPLIGIGLLYQWGYFSQRLDREGWQQEDYNLNDPEKLPVRPVRDAAGEQLTVSVNLPGQPPVEIAVWVADVGRVPLLLLDTNLDSNSDETRGITDRLYGGDAEHRIRQEIVLGVGGVRAVTRYCELTGTPAPEVFHLNEGHAGFSGLERVGQLMSEQGTSFDAALTQVRSGTVFTTHTPVPAGIDRFELSTVRHYFDADETGTSRLIPALPVEAALSLGREADGRVFNMAHMGFRLAQRSNGVAKLHGAVSREMFKDLYPGFDAPEVPITSVTNGVHLPSWASRQMRTLLDSKLDPDTLWQSTDWSALRTLSDRELTDARNSLRGALVTMARERAHESWIQRGVDEAEIGWIADALDPDILTIGFARRVSTYKRLTLMLQDPERLRRILLDPERPVQIVIAGKAHPADHPGKEFLQQMVRFADEQGVRHRIMFLPDYDIKLAYRLVSGADVWLNNPIRPEEASGTSGMKAVLNGALTLSISDGWWDEMRSDRTGWTIPTVETPDRAYRDRLEAAALYDLLEHSIVPLFYDRDAHGISTGWNTKIRNSLVEIGPQITATRMVREYSERLYLPAAQCAEHFEADPGRAAAFTEWKRTVSDRWDGLALHDPDLHDGDSEGTYSTGDPLTLSVAVDLNGLEPDDVDVQGLIGAVDEAGDLKKPQTVSLAPTADGRFAATFRVANPGTLGYTVRVVPKHDVLVSPAELGMVTYVA